MADAFLRIHRMVTPNTLAKGERQKDIYCPAHLSRTSEENIIVYPAHFLLVFKLIFGHPFIAKSLPNQVYFNILRGC